jgi:hypothetical protein
VVKIFGRHPTLYGGRSRWCYYLDEKPGFIGRAGIDKRLLHELSGVAPLGYQLSDPSAMPHNPRASQLASI